MNSAPCSRVSHLLVLHLILLLGFGLKLDAAELASARSGPTGGQAKLFFQPTDEPLTRLEGWQLIYGFQMRSVRVAETPIGYPDLVHGQINEAYQVPVSTAPKRRFRKQTITSNWAADFMAPLPHTIEGSMNLTIQKTISVDGTLIDLITGSFQEREVTAYRVVTGYGDFGPVYGDAVFTQTTTTNGTPLRSFGNLARAPTPVFENGTVLTHYSQTNRPDTIGFWSGKCIPYWSLGYVGFQPRFWGADRVTHVEAGGVDPIFGTAAPTEWTATKVVFRTANASLPIPLVNTGTYDYTLELSEEDTMADTLARYNQSLAVAALETLPWNTERRVVGGGQKQDFAGAPDSFSATFYNESARQTEGYLTSEKAQIRFVVPPALRVPGAGYRMRVIETFQANQSPGIVETVAIYEVDLQAGQWESPVITPVFRDNGTTELRYFTLAAELIQPRRVAALPGATTGPAPREYLQRGPVFQNQAQVTDTTNQGQAQRRILVDSLSLQQINLADTFLSHYALSGLTATWSVLAGATASVRLWGWHNDGSALGQWTLLAPGADLQGFYNSPFLGEPTDYLFVEAATGGEATVRITITVGGKEAHDDLLVQSRPISIELAVDANRDGTIKLVSENASDATSAAKPFRFWSNDDIDRMAHESNPVFTEDEEDDLLVSPTGKVDWEDNVANSRRDLEDFSRLVVSTNGLIDAFKNGDLYMGLKWADTTGTPAIKLHWQYDPTGSTSYLTNDFQAALQVTQNAILNQRYAGEDVLTSPHTLVETGELFVLPQGFWLGLPAGELKRTVLFEGCKAGKGQLKLVILKRDGANYTEIGEGPGVWLDLQRPKEFIERWSAGDGDADTPVLPVVRQSANSGTFAAPTTDEQKDYVLYVHGYNMQEFEKQRWIETTYKRLYHLGYKGRVAGFTWPCAQSFLPFDDSEVRAWEAGAQLKNLLSALKGGGYRVHVLAHSQGNIVVAEALRQWKAAGNTTPLVSTYIASQAAIAAHCYDPAAPLIPGFAGSLSDDGTPNVYLNYPPTSLPYLGTAATSGTAGRFRNFQNPGDWALTGNSINPFSNDFKPIWQAGQRLKPDFGYGWASTTGFYKAPWIPGVTDYHFPDDRFKIFAYCAEGRSLALGSTETEGVFAGPDTNLSGTFGYGLEHKWHSGQFRSYMAVRYPYWNQVLIEAGLKSPQ